MCGVYTARIYLWVVSYLKDDVQVCVGIHCSHISLGRFLFGRRCAGMCEVYTARIYHLVVSYLENDVQVCMAYILFAYIIGSFPIWKTMCRHVWGILCSHISLGLFLF